MGEAGERAVLRRILEALPPSEALVGPGDDAAVIAAPDGRVVVTTDTLVHGPDFRLAWSPPRLLGRKAAAVNLADIAAMGARPTALIVALALPDDTPLDFVSDLAAGMVEACADLAPDCRVEGGDLTVSDTLTIAVTALGSLDGRPPVLRSGARPGDRLELVGEAGVAARGLEILFERFVDASGSPVPVDVAGMAPALSDADAHAVAMQRAPRPPVSQGAEAAIRGATAMMDVSDGLALDARRMAEASGVTLDIERRQLGPDPERALRGGEDHALLVAMPEAAQAVGHPIGWVRERGVAAVTVDGAAYDVRGGWDPYSDWDSARG